MTDAEIQVTVAELRRRSRIETMNGYYAIDGKAADILEALLVERREIRERERKRWKEEANYMRCIGHDAAAARLYRYSAEFGHKQPIAEPDVSSEDECVRVGVGDKIAFTDGSKTMKGVVVGWCHWGEVQPSQERSGAHGYLRLDMALVDVRTTPGQNTTPTTTLYAAQTVWLTSCCITLSTED